MKTICDFYDANGHSQLNIPVSYYWDIPIEKRYDIYNTPNEHTIGDLNDDLQFLKEQTQDNEVIEYSFVWLGNILRAIGCNLPI